MNFTEKPEVANLPEQHYVFIEKIGPFQETAKASWDEANASIKKIKGAKITGAMANFRMQPQMVYRAGFTFDSKPASLPEGAKYELAKGGQYSKFTLIGSYMNLGPAWGKTMELTQKLGIQPRDAFYLERYINDPATTPENELVSELMVPTK